MKIFGKDYSSSYDTLYYDKNYQSECEFLENIFKKYNKNVTTILDLGCGTGGHALIFAQKGYSVTGVDISEDTNA